MTDSSSNRLPSSSSPQNEWDQRYDTGDYVFGTAPNAFLRSQQSRLPTQGRALAVADGEGRNGVWLAEQGLDVLSIDNSEVGLRKAQVLATTRGTKLQTLCADLLTWDWPDSAYDVIVSIFLHLPSPERTGVHRLMARALKPGGILILEAYHQSQLGRSSGGPQSAALLYDLPSLESDFSNLTLLDAVEGTTLLAEGSRHQGSAKIVRIVAIEPIT